jgi:hypothetical protein
MTEENPHRILLWTTMSLNSDDRIDTLECDADGCEWQMPYTKGNEARATRMGQEHAQMWVLLQANAGHVKLIADLSRERDELRDELIRRMPEETGTEG